MIDLSEAALILDWKLPSIFIANLERFCVFCSPYHYYKTSQYVQSVAMIVILFGKNQLTIWCPHLVNFLSANGTSWIFHFDFMRAIFAYYLMPALLCSFIFSRISNLLFRQLISYCEYINVCHLRNRNQGRKTVAFCFSWQTIQGCSNTFRSYSSSFYNDYY